MPSPGGSLTLGPGVLRDLDQALSREWLLADGLGGYASSTVIGLNTRRYHGLLVAATRPPVGRMVLLSRLEEAFLGRDGREELGSNAYPGTIHPRGYEKAQSFTLDPLPTLTWAVASGRLSRTVCRVRNQPATVIVYQYDGDDEPRLELRPLLAYRDHHHLQRQNDAIFSDVGFIGDDVLLRPYRDCPPLQLHMPGAQWQSEATWYRDFEYARERERGLPYHEDLFSHGILRCPLTAGEPVYLLAWAGTIPPDADPASLVGAERKRLLSLGSHHDGLVGDLRRAADAFLVRRGEPHGRTVVAGYPWFSDWGRDTMISLPGLCLSTERYPEARGILAEYARHVDAGMIPNRFPEQGEAPEYNTVDAALWMVMAVHRYAEATGEPKVVARRLGPSVTAVIEGYRKGTRHGIRMTPEGLIAAGEPGLQLTWMDAKVGDEVITPRRGHPVEIQALWYNALLIGADLLREVGEPARAADWTTLAGRTRDSFRRAFWSENLGYLADVVAGGTRDLSLRPNQLFAIGLPHSLLAREQAMRVLQAVRAELLTPVGMRTLAPSDPAYRGRYDGDPRSRDGAYHQGTVWPYLMGIYFDAVIRVQGEEGKEEIRHWLERFAAHLEEAGLGTVSEVFDGDPPHRPGGAIAQAWSVAELLRVARRISGLRSLHGTGTHPVAPSQAPPPTAPPTDAA